MDQPGVVLSIHLLTAHGKPPVPAAEARALVGHGLEGDVHGKRKPDSSRQVLLVDRRTLEAIGFPHGALREQLTVDFPGLDHLLPGTLLRVGEAILEITGPCDPCETIGQLNAAADPAVLRDALQGRRGMVARVVAVRRQGRIRRGDTVVVDTARPVSTP